MDYIFLSDDEVADMIKDNKIEKVYEYFNDPILQDELFHTVTTRFQPPNYEYEQNDPKRKYVIQVMENLEEIPRTNPKITYEEFIKKLMGNDYVFGEAAIYLYNLKNDLEVFSIDTVSVFYHFNDALKFFHYGYINFDNEETIIKKREFLDKANRWLRKNSPGSPRLFNEDFFYEISLQKCVANMKDILPSIDISISRLVFDVKKEEFVFFDDQTQDDLENRTARYHNIPENFYLDRFGKRRMITKSLRRILKYIDRGYKIKKPEGGFFSIEEVWKEIIENKIFENNTRQLSNPICLGEKKIILRDKLTLYGYIKSLESINDSLLTQEISPSDVLKDPFALKRRYFFKINFNGDGMERIICRLANYIKNCINDFRCDSFIISGSSLVAYHLPKEKSFVPNDIDVWITVKDVREAKRFLKFVKRRLRIREKTVINAHESGYKDSFLIYDLPIFNGTFKIQFLFVNFPIDHEYVNNFDMDFCKISLNRNFIQKDSYATIALQTKKSEYQPRLRDFIEDGNDLVLTDRCANRVEKYISRGFELTFMNSVIRNGRDVRIPNGKNENLKFFF